jgi:hypothetical protein
VIVLSRLPESRIAGHGLEANVQTGRIGVQAISSVANPELAAFCTHTHSAYTHGMEEELAELVRQANLGFLVNYEITWQTVSADAPALKLRVQSPDGWAETLVPLKEPE